MRKQTRTWLLRPLVLGLAAAALWAPSAPAAPHEGANLSEGSGTVYSTPHNRPLTPHDRPLTPHDRPVDGPWIKGAGLSQRSVNPSSSFDWADAGVVAGLGLVLLSFVAVQARRRTIINGSAIAASEGS
jgi:hypothetical protein